mgnify:FL=1
MNYRMKDIRVDNDLTQREVAHKLKVNQNTYKGWENESDNIPLYEFNRFCELFEVSLDYAARISPGRESKTNKNKKKIDSVIIGDNLEKIRKEKNIKQKDLAKIMGVSPSTYINYKRGVTTIQTEILKNVAKHFKISMDWIVGKKENKNI